MLAPRRLDRARPMDCRLSSDADAPAAGRPDPNADVPFDIVRPTEQTLPVVLASPHSGRRYSEPFLAASRLDPQALRRSEDSFVDEIFAEAAARGAPLLRAHFPRAYVDVNREPYELDPEMFAEALPAHVNSASPRVAAGLGTIARIVAQGQEIYRGKLPYAEAERRIADCHRPYHAALADLLEETRRRFGYAILIDCHSMPTMPGLPLTNARGRAVDFVLGDLHGSACAPAVTEAAVRWLTGQGYAVERNAPYAGGYTTRHYGRPAEGRHALQIEISRALYMDEPTIRRRPYLATLARQMADLVETLGRLDPALLDPMRG